MVSGGTDWNWSIIVQAFLLAPIVLLSFLTPNHYLDVRAAAAEKEATKLAEKLEGGHDRNSSLDSSRGSISLGSPRGRTDSVAMEVAGLQ